MAYSKALVDLIVDLFPILLGNRGQNYQAFINPPLRCQPPDGFLQQPSRKRKASFLTSYSPLGSFDQSPEVWWDRTSKPNLCTPGWPSRHRPFPRDPRPPHSPGSRNNDQALDVEDEEKDLPVSDQFEQPRLVDAAHSERYGETLRFDYSYENYVSFVQKNKDIIELRLTWREMENLIFGFCNHCGLQTDRG